jgi:hypothetical protein
MSNLKPSLWWALSPLVFELAGVAISGAGVVMTMRYPVVGGALIGIGIVLWVAGFGRVRRRRNSGL